MYRVIFVVGQHWLKFGERAILNFFLIFGIAGIFVVSLLLALYDEKNTTERICFHFSIQDIEIILSYKVGSVLQAFFIQKELYFTLITNFTV